MDMTEKHISGELIRVSIDTHLKDPSTPWEAHQDSRGHTTCMVKSLGGIISNDVKLAIIDELYARGFVARTLKDGDQTLVAIEGLVGRDANGDLMSAFQQRVLKDKGN